MSVTHMHLAGGTPNHSANRNKHSELITVLKMYGTHAIFQSNKTEQRAYFSSVCLCLLCLCVSCFVTFIFVFVLCYIRLLFFCLVLVVLLLLFVVCFLSFHCCGLIRLGSLLFRPYSAEKKKNKWNCGSWYEISRFSTSHLAHSIHDATCNVACLFLS